MTQRQTCKTPARTAALLVLALQTASLAGASSSGLDYKGYHVEYQSDQPPGTQIIESVKRQIDICDNVHVPAQMRKFFKSVPLYLVPPSKGTPAAYAGISRNSLTGKITIQQTVLPGNKPILLHEMLHGAHAKILPGGFSNPRINDFYLRAKHRFSSQRSDGGTDYFLSNAKEFFAVTASIYLFGDIPRPPYKMSAIRKAMPRYAGYLAELFAEQTQSSVNPSKGTAAF